MVVSMSEVPSTPFKNWERVPGDSDADADVDSNADDNDIIGGNIDSDADTDDCADADAGSDDYVDADADADTNTNADSVADADSYQGLQCSMKSQSRSQFQAMLKEEQYNLFSML